MIGRITAQQILNSLVENDGLILVEDHSHINKINDKIKFQCEAIQKGIAKEDCEKIIIKSLRITKNFKCFCCNKCKIYKKRESSYTKLYRIGTTNNLKIDYNKFINIKSRDEIIDFPCVNSECEKIVFKSLKAMEHGQIFHCHECYLKSIGVTPYTINTLNELFTKNNVTPEKDYSDEPLERDYIIGFYCKNEKCNILTKKTFGPLYEYQIFYCNSCYYEKENMIRLDRKFLDKFFENEGLEYAKDPGDITDRYQEVNFYCKTEKCTEIIIKRCGQLIEYKNFYCYYCETNIKQEYTDEMYYNLVSDYDCIMVSTITYLNAKKIAIGICLIKDCGKFFFKSFHKLYQTRLFYCNEHSKEVECNRKNNNKYNLKILDNLFDQDEDYEYDDNEDFNKIVLEFKCYTKSCDNMCNRTAECLIETGNKFCKICTLDKLQIIEYSDELFETIIPVLYPDIKFEKIQNDNNILYRYDCSNDECFNTITKSFVDLIERQEIYCGCRRETTCDAWLRLFKGKYLVKFNKKYKDMKQQDKVSGFCSTYNCENHFCKTVAGLMNDEYPYCTKCSQQIGMKKAENTNMAIRGVKYVMQDSTIHRKNAFKRKEYKLPNDEIIFLRGYEPQMMDILLYQQEYKQEQLVTGDNKVPEIWYEMDDKNHRYYTDIYIPDEKRCIEVKSIFTFIKDFYENYLKHRATILAGYKHEIYILNDNGNILEIIRDMDPELEHEYRNKYQCFVNIKQELEDESNTDSDYNYDTEDEQENESESEIDEEFELLTEELEEDEYEDDWISEDEPIYSESDNDE